jgi:PAS domain S-box-containing protein
MAMANSADFRRTAERLQHSDEWFRQLVEGVQDYALFMLDPAGRVASWNAGAERIKGYRPGEIVGRHFSRFYTPEEIESGKPGLALAAAAASGHLEDEGWRVRKDGSRFWARVAITALRDKSGKLRGFGKVTRDLTERRRLERELLDTQERLEAAERLLMASDPAGADPGRVTVRESERGEIDAFMQMVARDLQTPLRHIEQLTAQVREGLVGVNDSARRLNAITHSAVRLGKLTGDLMLFTQADRLHQRRRRVELSPLVIEARNQLGASATSDRVNWKIGNLPAVVGDRALLRVVFANLLSNALKFTWQRDRAFIEIGALPGAEDGHEVVIAVMDNGIGFDQRFAQKVFDAFRHVHGAREFEGAGIGLATAKRIVEGHGGRIWAEGAPDVGASFFVALKCAG